tara:strand:+ start:620 stop:1417 length:798 start_codon:yes stop_codon:yes gene_type:complete
MKFKGKYSLRARLLKEGSNFGASYKPNGLWLQNGYSVDTRMQVASGAVAEIVAHSKMGVPVPANIASLKGAGAGGIDLIIPAGNSLVPAGGNYEIKSDGSAKETTSTTVTNPETGEETEVSSGGSTINVPFGRQKDPNYPAVIQKYRAELSAGSSTSEAAAAAVIEDGRSALEIAEEYFASQDKTLAVTGCIACAAAIDDAVANGDPDAVQALADKNFTALVMKHWSGSIFEVGAIIGTPTPGSYRSSSGGAPGVRTRVGAKKLV